MRFRSPGWLLGATCTTFFLVCVVVPAPASAQTLGNVRAEVAGLRAAGTNNVQPIAANDQTTVEPDRWTVTAFLGPGFGGGLQGNALDLGVAAGYNWTTRLGLEGEFGYAHQGTSGLLLSSSNTETYSVNALYHVPIGSRWLPYGTFGIGAIHGAAQVTAASGGQVVNLGQSSTDFAFNLGGGVKTELSSIVRFRGDLRFFDAGGTLPNFWRVYGGLTFLLGSR